MEAGENRLRNYERLQDLILYSCRIRTLYPDIPKEQVFIGGPRPSAASASGEQEVLDSSQGQAPVRSSVHRGISEGTSWLRLAFRGKRQNGSPVE